MVETERLLARLDEIATAVAANDGLALLALGSVGQERTRLDAYSDLDFFVIARPGGKPPFLDSIAWLEAVAPVGYAFRNTPDGYKLLFADGVFCEYAIFEPQELATAAFTAGRLIWYARDFDPALAEPAPRPPAAAPVVEWLLGEALTNLYVGLGRYRRGERYAAYQFLGYAVDRVVELASHIAPPAAGSADPFAPARRFEQRFPAVAAELPAMLQGYGHVPQSAHAVLTFLEAHFDVNPAVRAAILARCDDPQA